MGILFFLFEKESGNFLEKVALKLRDDEYIIIDRKKDRP